MISTTARVPSRAYKALITLPIFRQTTTHLINHPNRRAMSTKTKSEDEWRAVLNKEQFRILRQKVSDHVVEPL